MSLPLTCDRGHRLTRYELIPCTQHKNHKAFVCPMRVGARRCGDQKVFPPLGASCGER